MKNGAKPQPVAPPVAAPEVSPFASRVAGAGLVEASTENIAIGTPTAGVVMEVLVKHGQQVKAGDPLFRSGEPAFSFYAVKSGRVDITDANGELVKAATAVAMAAR